MAELSWKKSPQEIEYFKTNPIVMGDEEGLYFAYITDPAALANVLPQGMDMVSPVVFGYVTHIKDPSFCVGYHEAALMTIGNFGGQPGVYPLAFLLDKGDTGTFMGRDVLSIPKKTADSITLARDGNKICANVKRLGIDIIDITAEIGEFNDPMCAQVFAAREPGAVAPGLNYFYKFAVDMGADGKVAINDVRLLACPITMTYHTWENVSVQVALGDSVDDPWAALPVVKPLGGGWTNFDCAMNGVAKVIPIEGEAAEDTIAKNVAARYDQYAMNAK